MDEHNEPGELKERHRRMIVRGVAAALLLAALSLAEYYLSIKLDGNLPMLVVFMVAKGWIILDIFMHVRALRSEGAH